MANTQYNERDKYGNVISSVALFERLKEIENKSDEEGLQGYNIETIYYKVLGNEGAFL